MKKVLKQNKKPHLLYSVQILEKNKQGMCPVCKTMFSFQDYSFTDEMQGYDNLKYSFCELTKKK